MKVCHMTSVHSPEDVRIFHKECVSLAKAGYEVYLVEQGDSYEKNGVHIVGVGEIPKGRLKRMTQWAKMVYQKALALDADIYHFHDPELLPYGLKLKKRGKKVIFDSHEKYSEQLKRKPYLPRWCTELIAKLYTVYEKRVLKQIDAVIFPCLKDGKHPFEGMCHRTITLDNYPLLEELYEKYDPSIEKEPRSVCYVGGLSYGRGITHLIKAAGLADCTVYLAGPFFPAGYQLELEALPDYKQVKYLGMLKREEVLETLQRSQIGMANILMIGQYNQFDNMATKVYEYMALGLPVILSRAPYNERMIKEYDFGICVAPDDSHEIAAAISYLLGHPEEAARMGKNGRKAVKDVFNWEIEADKLLQLYREL